MWLWPGGCQAAVQRAAHPFRPLLFSVGPQLGGVVAAALVGEKSGMWSGRKVWVVSRTRAWLPPDFFEGWWLNPSSVLCFGSYCPLWWKLYILLPKVDRAVAALKHFWLCCVVVVVWLLSPVILQLLTAAATDSSLSTASSLGWCWSSDVVGHWTDDLNCSQMTSFQQSTFNWLLRSILLLLLRFWNGFKGETEFLRKSKDVLGTYYR